jgi:serine/threonine protein kinase
VGSSGPNEAISPPVTTPSVGGARSLAPGEVVADRYRIVEFLAEGGMGAVYRAEHMHMRKAFALKVLHSRLVKSPEIVARFEREAIAAGSIDHPNVASATDFGRLPDGSFFLVLEFVRGRSLRDLLDAGAVEHGRAVKIMRGIVAGVGAAHGKGIVHRDLKPENIMLVDNDGDPDFVKVLDFGIAKVDPIAPSGSASGAVQLTAIGSVIGTPEYMSPEQALGEAIDTRSDMYSIGVIFYELLSGACPFVGSAVAILQRHVLEPPPAFSPELMAKIDPRTNDIVQKLLAKQPQERFDSLSTLGAQLAEIDAPAARVVIDASALPAPPATTTAVHVHIRDLARRVSQVPRPVRIAALVLGLGVLAWVIVSSQRGDGDHKHQQKVVPAPAQTPVASQEAPPTPQPPAAAVEGPSAPPVDTTAVVLPPPPGAQASATAGRQRSGGNGSGQSAPASSGTNTHRHTGPGGIYIPPPKDWFK